MKVFELFKFTIDLYTSGTITRERFIKKWGNTQKNYEIVVGKEEVKNDNSITSN